MIIGNSVNIKFQRALITGATSGLGLALARDFAAKRIPLILTGRDSKTLQQLETELGATVFPCDLSKPQERTALIKLIRKEQPDLVVNCAGIGHYGNACDSISKQSEILEINIQVLTEITLEAVHTLIEHGKPGRVINISSAIAYFPCPGMAVYSASKAFVNNFSQALDVETRPYNIRVLCSCLGQVATPFSYNASKGKHRQNPRAFLVMSPQKVVRKIWKQIHAGKSLQIIDWKYRWIRAFARLIPLYYLQKKLQNSIKERVSLSL